VRGREIGGPLPTGCIYLFIYLISDLFIYLHGNSFVLKKRFSPTAIRSPYRLAHTLVAIQFTLLRLLRTEYSHWV
jgi:hypothetical protein